MLQALQWRLVGPFRGGRVLAVTGIPGDSRHFYFGAVDGGVWATEDAGRTWQPIFDSEPAASIGALAVAPSAPATLYVGTGEADMRSDIAHGAGMYKSADAGKHWSFLGLADSRQIGRILVDPRNPELVFVAALGHAYGPNAERGVFRSKDGGAHWSKVLFQNRHRRHRPCIQTRRSGYHLCGAVADAASALERLSTVERSWQRTCLFPMMAAITGAPSVATASWPPGPHGTRRRAEPAGTALCACRWGPRGEGAFIDPTMAACIGGMFRPTSASWNRGWYFSASRSIRRTPIVSM